VKLIQLVFPVFIGRKKKIVKKQSVASALLSGLIPQSFLTLTSEADSEYTKPTYRCTAARN
jgi:hypothetical protein